MPYLELTGLGGFLLTSSEVKSGSAGVFVAFLSSAFNILLTKLRNCRTEFKILQLANQ